LNKSVSILYESDNHKMMKKYILTLFLVSGLAACTAKPFLTAQDLTVNLVGTEAAFCTLSTDKNRYNLSAPGQVFIERDMGDLTIDCKDNLSDRRRVKTVESELGLGYAVYPSVVTIDFSQIAAGDTRNGFRTQRQVMTERSFSYPIALDE